MTLTFELEDFNILEETNGGYSIWKSALCEVDLTMTELPEPMVMPSLNDPGDPGSPAQFEISEIRLTDIPHGENRTKAMISLILTETQFITFFYGGSDVINNAYEWAAEQEIDYDY